MKFVWVSLLLFTISLQAQYVSLLDPRSGKPVRYAGDFQSKPLVMVPRSPRIPARSFRGVWVATVNNIDMPICRNVNEFKNRYRRIVDNLKQINATAIIFQVRPLNDAFYPSRLNPYSRFMTGSEGMGFSSFDPMQFMVDEAHRRGLEFHAWLNPYRVSLPVPSKSGWLKSLSPMNFARRNPGAVLAVPAGKGKVRLFLDPGNPKTIQFFLATVQEILQKYRVDAIHLDDYFYPYEEMGSLDIQTWRRYNPGKLTIDAWRRNNVSTLVFNTSTMIRNWNKKTGRSVKFGISPFGIWAHRTTTLQGSMTKGLESYSRLYADSRLWVKNRWVDYIVPQLYWSFGHNTAAYAALADWWAVQVRGTGVRLYAGLTQARVGTNAEWSNPSEIRNQMAYNLRHKEYGGVVIFSYARIFSPENSAMHNSSMQIISLWKSAK